MDNTTHLLSKSRSPQPHKFFERHLDNDLTLMSNYLQEQFKRIENGEIPLGPQLDYNAFPDTNSITTSEWYRFNAFQFYLPEMFNLLRAVKSMTLEACEYYGINFEEQYYHAQAWFNINYSHKGKLNWHDHAENGAPTFHGYYCVNAEPSTTHYKVGENYVDNINKNNRAILSETGHPHAMADWDWEGPRITIAYDVFPGSHMYTAWEQHWVPLL
jgi:hypothetical protein